MKHEKLRAHLQDKKEDLVADINSVLERHGIQGEVRGLTFATASTGECPEGTVPVVVIKVDPRTGATIRTIECR